MDKEKNNSGLIALVIFLFLLVLGLGGYIVYNKFYNLQDCSIITNNAEINQNKTDNLYSDTEINKDTLDELYRIIGVLPTSDEETLAPRHCLNVAVTNTTYLGIPNAQDVFSWYVTVYKKQADYEKYKDANVYASDGTVKVSAYNCAACFTIEKTEVEKFKQLYYFGPEVDFKFIKDNVENYNNIYSATQSLGSPVHCDYNVKHNIIETHVEKGTEGETIYLTDEQIVTRYDDVENSDISQLTKQTINYSFYRKNGDDTYRLDHVFHRNKVK